MNVTVQIMGTHYVVTSENDPAYMTKLGEYVDSMMAAVHEVAGTENPLKIAILTAMNIADELFRTRATRDLE